MRLEQIQSVVERGGTFQEKAFTIRADAKMFNILSDKIYSDKVGAIVREVSSNARDAHVMCGKHLIPFEIHLPNTLYPHFSVRDFGQGLTIDEMFGIYSTYSESTKSESNAPIGMFGIGAKSPFSYTDSFSVVSRVGGSKYTYSAYIGENGIPTIALLNEVTSDEPSGLEVIIPVKTGDYTQFERKVWNVLQYFKPLPTITGIDESHLNFQVPTYVVEGTGWGIRTQDSGPRVIQGGVHYPVDFNQVYSKLNVPVSPNLVSLTKQPIDLHFDMFDSDNERGCIDVSLSREALSYDTHSCRYLANMLDSVQREFRQKLQDQLDKEPSYWKACVVYSNMHQRFGSITPTGLVWNGREVFSRIGCNMSKYTKQVNASVFSQQIGFRNGSKIADDLTVQVNNAKIIFIDVPRGARARIKYYSNQNLRSNIYAFSLVENTSDGKQRFVEILEHLGNPEIELVSTLPTPHTNSSYRSVKKISNDTIECFKWVGNHRSNNKRQWLDSETSVSGGGIYVELSAYKIVHPLMVQTSAYDTNKFQRLDELIGSLKRLKVIPMDTTVYGIGTRNVKVIKNHTNWINLFDLVDNECVKDVTKNLITHERVRLYVRSYVYNVPWRALVDQIEKNSVKQFYEQISKSSLDPCIVDFFKRLQAVCIPIPVAADWNTVSSFSPALDVGVYTHLDSTVDEFKRMWENIVSTYKVIEFLNFNNIENLRFQNALLDLFNKGVK